MSQWRVPVTRTGSLGNRLTSRNSTPSPSTRAAITRPPEAPRSTAATVTGLIQSPSAGQRLAGAFSSEERCCYARVDRDEQARCQGQVSAYQREDRGRHVLREDLLLQQSALRVEGA